MAKKQRKYIRCPLCAKLSFAENFVEVDNHQLGVSFQERGSRPVGKGGWTWTKGEMTEGDLRLLIASARKAIRRLESVHAALPLTKEEAFAYLEEAEKAVEDARAELSFRRMEVEHMMETEK